MTDRELLGAAAQAAGIKALRCPNGVLRDCTGLHPTMNIFSAPEWSPLIDDGDALRLAVKLGIDVMHTNIHSPQVHAMADHEVACTEDSVTDPYVATRRAIVRAAAEIGRGV